MAERFGKSLIRTGGLLLALTSVTALSACQDGEGFSLLKGKPAGEESAAAERAGEVIERDVEAPEVFSVNEDGLWDGRPSLGGVWVAHPSVKDPERVMIRNPANGQSVIGALFRRERDNPGPKLQISSDAAEALGVLAGAPSTLEVVALRRETVEIAPPEPEPLVEGMVLAEPEPIESGNIDAVTAAADKALSEIETRPLPKPGKTAEAPKPAPVEAAPAAATTTKPSAPKVTSDKMYVQLGIFSVEANAKGVVAQMSKEGIIATIKKEESKGKTFWRVLAGPAASSPDRAALLKKVQSLGYTDAYAVSK
ncbi:SPOR domain-containing protein [Pseudothioclava arenosa]|uniref:SPOR domain-containing protein n=1 Tax=Pseudothioclava arenosa TaxID=1795308 RepID=A0A2A4CSN1_9RHOB|nr:SPOR domain-containing protein [Pseudothioclava arenosa]PCD77126.1 SPOR domain-containing protein [Pseudothioclava arenosa]